MVSVTSHGAVELHDPSSNGTFLVNGQRVNSMQGSITTMVEVLKLNPNILYPILVLIAC